MFKETADIQTADMLNLPVPEAHYHNIVLKPSEAQKKMVEGLSDRAERVRNKMVDSSTDNIAVVSFNEHKKVVHKHHLANIDYAAYEEYIKNEREKERETQEFLQKQKDEKEAKKYNNYKYKCPMCGSNKIANISTAKKVVSAEILGLASAKIGKTYQCDECKYMW